MINRSSISGKMNDRIWVYSITDKKIMKIWQGQKYKRNKNQELKDLTRTRNKVVQKIIN